MFAGLSTALTSLYTQQKALEVTGNNIANANTEGYSRQRVELEPAGGAKYASFFSSGIQSGSGVNVKDIARLRDQFLEVRGQQEHASQGAQAQLKATYASVEGAFSEPGENGVQAQLAEYWKSWDGVANRPEDEAGRLQVVEQAQTLVSTFNQAAGNLDKLQKNGVDELKSDASSINAMAQNIADLNKAIRSTVNGGQSPNELLDQRDLLVSKLSDLVGVTTRPTESGSIEVSIGGVALVRDDKINKLEVDDTGTPVIMRWDQDGNANNVTDGFPATISGGQVGGLLDSVNSIIPKYRTSLDAVAKNVIDTVNAQQSAGVDQDGVAGTPFFSGTKASDIAVSATLVADPRLVAAAAAGGGELDGENARKMAELASAPSGPDTDYRNLIDTLGVEAQRANRQYDIQTGITNAVDSSRDSSAGVNLDEEMTNLIRYQKSYNASAKYLSVMDSVMDNLLNMVR